MALLKLSDGRDLEYHVHGAPDGSPVFFLPTASDSGFLRYHDDAFTASLGVQLIGVNYPGIGRSTARRRRQLTDWPDTLAQLADTLGLDRFAIAAHGSGGPHALATAWAMPDRVTRLSLVAPIPPFSEMAMSDIAVCGELENVIRLHRWRLSWLFRLALRFVNSRDARNIKAYLNSTALTFPAEAPYIRGDAAQSAIFEASYAQSLQHRSEGIYATLMAVCAPWRFRPEDVSRPVTVFSIQDDQMVDPSMSFMLARRLAHCQTRTWTGLAHHEFLNRDYWRDFLCAALDEQECPQP
jgi:pimeloyl-ACP methyl ester carboxylesterase